MIQNEYNPDSASPPGDTLQEVLEDRDITQAELAAQMGVSLETVAEIINGKVAITSETALQFEQALGIKAGFWINRERHYQEAKQRRYDTH